MNRLIKLGVVLTGYAAAICMAYAAVYVRQLHTQNTMAQASAGMYAFGDFTFFLVVFGVVALVPTVWALSFLRPFEKFWTVFSIAALALAVTGPVAIAVIQLHQSIQSKAGILLMFERVAVAPLIGFFFLICTVIAPTRRSCWVLLAAALIEFMVGVYVVIFLWVQHSP